MVSHVCDNFVHVSQRTYTYKREDIVMIKYGDVAYGTVKLKQIQVFKFSR
jgi:hypothetical protein